jgi:uncharacterized iron-regulated membrane protein
MLSLNPPKKTSSASGTSSDAKSAGSAIVCLAVGNILLAGIIVYMWFRRRAEDEPSSHQTPRAAEQPKAADEEKIRKFLIAGRFFTFRGGE